MRPLARAIGVACITMLAAASAIAQTTPFMNAVAFALTGSDGAAVRVIDQANCVFMINPKTEGGRVVGEVFHLNNVQADRLTVQPWHNVVGRWVQVELNGASTVYEYTGTYDINTANPVMTREQQEMFQALGRPRRSDSFTIKIYTMETDRLTRAWQYIYSHGCKSSRSAF